jgi:beta-phosphoglucomutase
MQQQGAEIILDTAIFWQSRVEFNTQFQNYEIRGVIGADEYHELVHNNSFTNRMVQWHLEKAVFVYDWLHDNFPEQAAQLVSKLQITPTDINKWQDIIHKIYFPIQENGGLIEQFAGFFQLKDINLTDYEPRQRSMQVVLGVEGINKWQILKQPDVLMLLYLMRQSGDFPYNQKTLTANWDYYAPRTDITYGSSLAPSIHAILAADLGKSKLAYQHFLQAALVDLEDKRGNTQDGIHGASAGGIWQAVVFGFGGIKIRNNQPVAHPHLPPNWTRLKFKLYWRGQWHEFDLYSTPPQFPHPVVPSPQIQGTIFDLDGVLTDTAEYHYQAWQRLADEEGIPFNRQANEALRGVSRRASLMLIIGNRRYSDAEIEEMMERKNQYYGELIKNISSKDLLPGAVSLLDQLRQAQIKIAIGSGSKNARTVIERLGIIDKVDVIADGYSVQKPKPAPDLFLFAAQQLGLAPSLCVVFEDATAGIAAGLAAGMWTVGLGPGERVGAAHVVLPNLAGIKWVDIRAKLTR